MLIKNRFGRVLDVPEDTARAMVQKKEAELVDEAPAVESTPEQVNPLACVYCEKVLKSETGLKIHLASCKKKVLSSQ